MYWMRVGLALAALPLKGVTPRAVTPFERHFKEMWQCWPGILLMGGEIKSFACCSFPWLICCYCDGCVAKKREGWWEKGSAIIDRTRWYILWRQVCSYDKGGRNIVLITTKLSPNSGRWQSCCLKVWFLNARSVKRITPTILDEHADQACII